MASPLLGISRPSVFPFFFSAITSRCWNRRISPPLSRYFTSNSRRRRALLERHASRRTGFARINYLLFSLTRHLERGSYDAAVKHIHEVLFSDSLDETSRASAFEKAISLFCQYGRFRDASEIYMRMLSEGVLPSAALRSKMLVTSMVLHLKDDEELLSGFKRIFAEDQLDEPSLRDLMMFMEHQAHLSVDIINDVALLYAKARGESFTFSKQIWSYLVYLHASNGLIDSAERLLGEYVEGAAKQDKAPQPDPYTTLMSQLSGSENGSVAAFDSILQRMESDEVVADLHVFNTLIAAEVRRHRYQKAFMLYGYLMDNRSRTLRPDAYTFGSLFRALVRLNYPRNAHSRKDKRPENIIPPRQLFKSMMDCHFGDTRGRTSYPSSVVSTSVFNLALRTFLTVGDFSAAFLVLRSFKTCEMQPNAKTYQIVFQIILNRIRNVVRAPRPHPVRRWMNRFLGHPLGPMLKASSAKETDLVPMLLGIGREPRLSLRSADYFMPKIENGSNSETSSSGPNPSQTGYNSSSAPDVDHLLAGQVWNTVPLERILRRAILASLPGSSDSRPAKAVSEVIAEAKKDLIPHRLPSLTSGRPPLRAAAKASGSAA